MPESNQLADEELTALIAEAKAGNQGALNQLLEMLRPVLKAQARRGLRGREREVDPSDVVQETLLAVCRDLPGFEGQTPRQFHAWVNRIAANRLVDAIRKIEAGNRDTRRTQSMDAVNGQGACLADGLDAGTSPPERPVIRNEQLERVLAKLPDDQRTAFTMRQLEGATLDEIAARLKLPATDAALVWERAVRAVRRHLRAERS